MMEIPGAIEQKGGQPPFFVFPKCLDIAPARNIAQLRAPVPQIDTRKAEHVLFPCPVQIEMNRCHNRIFRTGANL